MNNFLSVKNKRTFTLRTCPLAAANAQGDLLVKNDFLEFVKVQWIHFTGDVAI